MIRAFLRSKFHRATVTHVDIDYEGSLSLDEDLMKAAGLAPFERIDVWNVSNGERFSTYIIRAEKGSRQVGVYGAAGRKVKAATRSSSPPTPISRTTRSSSSHPRSC